MGVPFMEKLILQKLISVCQICGLILILINIIKNKILYYNLLRCYWSCTKSWKIQRNPTNVLKRKLKE